MEHEVILMKQTGDYKVALVKSEIKHEYVVAKNYYSKEKGWGQGVYFRDINDAFEYFANEIKGVVIEWNN